MVILPQKQKAGKPSRVGSGEVGGGQKLSFGLQGHSGMEGAERHHPPLLSTLLPY